MEALSPEVAAEYAARAQAVRDRQSSGTFTPSWSLYGDKAIAKPSGSEIVRLMPRWDFADSLIKIDGKSAPNPNYKPRVAYYRAFEHWYVDAQGKIRREYCPKTGDPMVAAGIRAEVVLATSKIRCVICFSSLVLMLGSKDEKTNGKKIGAKEVFLFNALVGQPRRLNDAKIADIRLIALPGTIYGDISDIMTGGAKPQFARGNIMSPREGYDLLLNRPAGKTSGERWSVKEEPAPSPMYTADQTAAFKNWVSRLINLEETVKTEMKSEDGIFEAYYGRAPEPGEMDKLFAPVETRRPVPMAPQTATIQPGTAQPEEKASTETPEEPDEFMGLMPPGATAGGRAPRR